MGCGIIFMFFFGEYNEKNRKIERKGSVYLWKKYCAVQVSARLQDITVS